MLSNSENREVDGVLGDGPLCLSNDNGALVVESSPFIYSSGITILRILF